MRPGITYLFYSRSAPETFSATLRNADHVETEYFALVDQELESHLNHNYIEAALTDADILHAGRIFGSDEILTELQITSFSWFFLNTPVHFRAVSWKASPQLLIIRRDVWAALKGLNSAYKSDYTKVMDFSYRALRSGGRVFYDPKLLKDLTSPPQPVTVALADVFLFAYFNVHRKAATTILIYALIHSIRWREILRSYRKALAVNKPTNVFVLNHPCWKIIQSSKRKEISEYSAIIPTLNRYDYLPEAITSLLQQDFPPAEIIVYDQTDRDKRIDSFPSQFDATKVKFVYSDEKGQASARNNALRHTTREWCLLFDDDSVAMTGMASEHRRLLENGDYLVSTGASLSPGQEFSDLPYAINFYHLADVLDTGNLFIHKGVFDRVGYLDLAFNKGPGVDNDFGTHLYRSGYPVVFNPKSVRLHYKASTGGLRTFGVWSRAKTSLLGPYPPPSQAYTVRKYYPKKYWLAIYIRFYLKASNPSNIGATLLLWLLLPFKLHGSIKAAKRLEGKSTA